MDSAYKWQIAGGSIPGSDHTMPGVPVWTNSHDAYYFDSGDSYAVAIVSDGCGSGLCSEVGSKIAVRILGQILKGLAVRNVVPNWDRVRVQLLAQVSVMAQAMGVSLSEVVENYFLFTLVGVLAVGDKVFLFSCGDGMVSINGSANKLGPFKDNAPPYISYGILGQSSPQFVVAEYEDQDICTIAIGTDGVDYLPDLEADLKEWLASDLVFSNPDSLRRKLALKNVEKIQDGILRPGPLKDDITVILLRKQPL